MTTVTTGAVTHAGRGTRALAMAGLVTGLALTALLVATGVDIRSAILLPILVAWQAVAGVSVWRWFRPEASWLEQGGMGLSLGSAFAALAGVGSATIGLGPWGCLVPSLVALVVMLARRGRDALSVPAVSVDRAALVGMSIALFTGLAVLAYTLRSYPLSWEGSWTGYHPDIPFFEAIANSVARFGAFESPFMSGGVVRYHWLSYAWTGQLTVISGTEPFVSITRVLPFVTLVGTAAIVVAWTRRLSPSGWTPTVAGLLLTLGGFVGAVFGGVLTMDSPSQSMAVLWLLGLSLVVIQILTSHVRLLPSSLVLLTLTVSLIGGKVSAGAPAVAGIVLMTVVLAVRRSVGPTRAAAVLGVSLVGSAAAFAFFLLGSLGGGGLTLGSLVDKASSQQGLNPLEGSHGVLAGTLILVVAVLPRWAGVGWLMILPEWRWRPEVLLSIGLGVSSLGALVLFNSFNEIWFSSTVSGPLAVTTAVGAGFALDHLHDRPRPSARALLITTCVIAVIAYAIVWELWVTGASGGNVWVSTLRWMGPPGAWIIALIAGAVLSTWGRGSLSFKGMLAGATLILVFLSIPGRLLGAGTGMASVLDNGIRSEWFSLGEVKYALGRDTLTISDWTSTKMAVAAWLRDNAEPSDLMATNLTHGPFVPGVTALPNYVSGIGYQAPYGPAWMSPEMLRRENQVWDFIEEPSATTAQSLCDAGVRWLWVDTTITDAREWTPWATVQFVQPDGIAASFDPASCSR